MATKRSIAFAAAFFVVVGCGGPSIPSSSPASVQSSPAPISPTAPTETDDATTRHLALNGLEFDFPAPWSVQDQLPATTGFESLWAVIGTVPWGACADSDINCYYEQRLEPGQVSVTIGEVFLVDKDICEFGRARPDIAARGSADPHAIGSLARIAGRPAVLTDYVVGETDYYHSDEWRSWLIAVPGSTRQAYDFDARYRGPSVELLRAELDQMVASIRLGPVSESATQPEDCGLPFPTP